MARVNRRVVESLIKAGAFDRLHPNRRSMFDVLDTLLDQAQRSARTRNDAQGTLFSLEEFASEDIRKPLMLPDIPDWPETERLKMEKEGMGFYLSGHPLNKYADLMDKYATATTLSLKDAPSPLLLAGILTGVNITRTKRGEAMARGILEDLDGSVQVVFFPQAYSKHQALIASDDPVIIRARVKGDEENGASEAETAIPELIAEEVWPLDGADLVLAKRVIVRVPVTLRPDKVKSLKETVMNCRGTCSLCFEVETDEALVNIDAGKDYMVSPVRDFLLQLTEIVGPKGVELQ
jgi:DNA polymerase-3 subunit alpha